MAESKKKKSIQPPSRSSATERNVRKSVVGVLVLVTVFVLVATGSYLAWGKWGKPVTHQDRYLISAESIELTPQPSWIPSDVRAEAVRDGSVEDLSIFDKDLTIRLCRAFEMHPWVDHVNRVSKQPPSNISIDLKYRRPVAWVEVPLGVLPNNKAGLLPVDGKGVLLPPRDFSDDQVEDYVWIAVAGLTPCGLPGTVWGDPRVVSAAQIAKMMVENSDKIEIHRILVSAQPGDTRELGPPVFEVTTHSGARFVWGNAPGHEQPGEPTAVQKALRLARLARVAAQAEAPQNWKIDLRDPESKPPKERTALRSP